MEMESKMKHTYRDELEIVRQKHNGFLRPQDVVEYARNKKTRLHGYFEWDDTEAAKRYRLAQATALIKVSVIVEPSRNEKVRAYVSLSTDRHKGGGYRSIVEVMNDDALKEVLLQDAYRDLQHFNSKFEKLRECAELSNVFQAIDVSVPRVKNTEQHTGAAA